MEFNIKKGYVARVEMVVTENDTAVKFGSGDVYVLATPMMIGLMENAALKAVDAHLPQGYATVGTHLDVGHFAATPVGMKAYATAELVEVEGKKLKFKVEAFDEKDKIGEGWHSRYIIEVERFLRSAEKKGQK